MNDEGWPMEVPAPTSEELTRTLEALREDALLRYYPYDEPAAYTSTNGNGAKPKSDRLLRFSSPDEFLAFAPEEPEWVWEDYVGLGAVTLFAGPPKVAGKSTFVWALCRAVLRGQQSFCGRFLHGGAVVYLSEEPAMMLRPKVVACSGLPLRVVWRETTPMPKPPWEVSIAEAVEEAHLHGAKLVVVDTFANWAGFQAEQEQDAGSVERAVDALKGAAASGLAVVLIHHHKKGGGEGGEAVRGSSALMGAVDIEVDVLRLPEEGAPPRQRILQSESRWWRTPDALVVELKEDNDTYTLVSEGERQDLKTQTMLGPMLDAMPDEPPGWTMQQIADEMGVGLSRVKQLIPTAIKVGAVVRNDKGGRPFRHWATPWS